MARNNNRGFGFGIGELSLNGNVQHDTNTDNGNGLTTNPGREADDGVDWGGMPTFLDFSTGVSKMWSAFFPPPPRGGDTTIIEASNPMAGLMPMLPWIAGGGVALYLLTRKKS